ncbi:glutamyl-tRNA reductase-binding protein, chloroplastic-like [Salvia divinorum]|uniref:Glutamyl-tRNA reductase-binding protein, chloroplastic-like n=1 Tax=Salvia divinorum TaxID=28513 RepID=A0ABD1H247_SALDI
MADRSQVSHFNEEVNLSQLFHDHQLKATRLPPIEEVRTLLHHSVRGFLSSLSQEHHGYPFGSMVDFACDAYGSPMVAVSNLAAHTKNLVANPKCSLLVAKDPDDSTDLIVTIQGDALPVDRSNMEAIRTAYMAMHPDAFWVSQHILILFYCQSHMNKDHADDTKLIVQHSTSIPVEFATMLDVDSLGFTVKAGYEGKTFKLRIPFTRRATERKDVKTLIIEMLQAAKKTD